MFQLRFSVSFKVANLEVIPNWIIVMAMIIGIVGFLILFFWLLSRNPVLIEEGRYKKRCELTKEGYVSCGICVFVMCALIMM